MAYFLVWDGVKVADCVVCVGFPGVADFLVRRLCRWLISLRGGLPEVAGLLVGMVCRCVGGRFPCVKAFPPDRWRGLGVRPGGQMRGRETIVMGFLDG